jgi:ribonucleotide reductase alpha subunit
VFDPHDEEYLDLKNYKVNPDRETYGWTSNNSIYAELGMDYTDVCRRIVDNGEPGFAWLDNMRKYSRMKNGGDDKDHRVMGGNPCLEQSLESYELCCLVETFPHNHDSLEDYQRTLKYAYLYAKTVTLGRTHWAETNRVMLRNRRIGCSVSGVAQFITKNGMGELQNWLETGYDTIQKWDNQYSDWFAVPKSIKTTSVKPSGTVSLLAGATPGLHYPESRFYIRRIRLSKHSELLEPLHKAGYKVEPAFGSEDTTMVVEVPVDVGEGIRTAAELSIWEQFGLAAFLQRHWADNQVSCTVTFDPKKEGKHIATALNYFQYQLKGISMLPKSDVGAYKQMPYEEITDKIFNSLTIL